MEARSSKSWSRNDPPRPSEPPLTDRQRLESLLKDFNIRARVDETNYEPGPTTITIKRPHSLLKEQATVEGYSGFYTSWLFDKDGKFIKMGIWE